MVVKQFPVLLVLAWAGALGGCATGNCDPSTAGFFDGVSCQSSGAYDLRQNQLQGNLASARYNLQVERGRANAAAADADQARSEETRLSGGLSVMARENVGLRRRLAVAARQEGASAETARRQQNELAALERDRASAARGGATPDQVADLERRRRVILDAAAGL